MDSIQSYSQVYRRKVKNLEECVSAMESDRQRQELFAPVTPGKPNNVYVRRKTGRLQSNIEGSKLVPQCLDGGFISSDGAEMKEMGKKEFFQPVTPVKPGNVYIRREVRKSERKTEGSKFALQCLHGGFLSSVGAVMEEMAESIELVDNDLSIKGIEGDFASDDGFNGENGLKSCEEAKVGSIDLNVSEGLHEVNIYNGEDAVETTHGKKGDLEEGLEYNPSLKESGQQLCGGDVCCSGEDIVDGVYSKERFLDQKFEVDTDNGLKNYGELRQGINGEDAFCNKEEIVDAISDKERDLDCSKGFVELGEQLCRGESCSGEDLLGKDVLNQRLEDDKNDVSTCYKESGEQIFAGERELFASNVLGDLHKNEICSVENMLSRSLLVVSNDRTFGCLDGVGEDNSSTVLDNDSFLNDKQSNSATTHDIFWMQKNISNLCSFLAECNQKNQTNVVEENAFAKCIQNYEGARKDQLLQNNTFAPSTPLQTQNPNKRRKVNVDLNKKLQQKVKKKHHIPKISDGKPMRTSKSKTSKTPSGKGSLGKSKYLRKTKFKRSMTMPEDVTGPKEAHQTIAKKDDATLQSKQKSCKRQLNFDDGNYLPNANFTPLDSCPYMCSDLVQKCPVQLDQGTKEVLFHQFRFTNSFPSEFKKKRSLRRKRAMIKLFIKSGKKYKIRYILLVYFPKTFKKKRSRKRERRNFNFGLCKERATLVDLQSHHIAAMTVVDLQMHDIAHIHTFEDPLINAVDGDLDCNIVPNCYPNLTSPFNEQKANKFMVDLDTIACADALIDSQGLEIGFHWGEVGNTLELDASLKKFDAQDNVIIRNQLRLEDQNFDTGLIGPRKELPIEEKPTCLDFVDMQLMVVPQNIPTPVAEGGAIVPYKGANKVKIPKVLLDSVTMVEWNRLMLMDASDDGREPDYEKEKKWEEERQVFRGRVDSFIARMHLILGDRRFTPWRGSVVDSVIGVFLTQNVSDYLSSSAFVSLAAKFPLKSQDTFTGDVNITNAYTSKTIKERHNEKLENAKVVESSMTGDEGLVDNRADKNCIDTPVLSTYPSNLESCINSINKRLNDLKLENANMPSSWNQHAPSPNNCAEMRVMTNETSSGDTQVDETSNATNKMVERQEIALNPILDGSSRNMEKKIPNLREQQLILTQKSRKEKVEQKKSNTAEWEHLRKLYSTYGPRCFEHSDSVDWEAVRCASVIEVAKAIKGRGQHNQIAARIQEFLNKLVAQQNSIDLEWLRNCPPDKAKQYLLEIHGLGLKSVECVRLLTLQHVAFPVDTNVGRIAVRLGWVPLQPLPENLLFHLLERYPVMDDIQKYLWPRLCTLDQRLLYELHYHFITFGKVFCTKRKPNCNACPMKGECRHFASAFASAKLALPAPANNYVGPLVVSGNYENHLDAFNAVWPLLPAENTFPGFIHATSYGEPIIEEPDSPEPEFNKTMGMDIEDLCLDNDGDEIPTFALHSEKYMENSWNYWGEDGRISKEMSKALILLPPEAAFIPLPKLKNVTRLRTEHQVYELPDHHPLLESFQRREPDDPCHYLFAIWGPDDIRSAQKQINSQLSREVFIEETSLQSSTMENCETIKGTILIPCRTAMQSRFPLNGTYFQVNEVFVDYESSKHPINVRRDLLWNLPRRTAYCGSSTSAIFRGLPVDAVQQCFWTGYVCCRGFDRKTRSFKPLAKRFHRIACKAGKAASAEDDD